MSTSINPEDLWCPTILQVTKIHDSLVARFGGKIGIREKGLIESALARPIMEAIYSDNNTVNLYKLTATLCFGLVKNHGFIDGNKRTAFATSMYFIAHNAKLDGTFPKNAKMIISDDEVVSTLEGVALDTVSIKQLESWFKKILTSAVKS